MTLDTVSSVAHPTASPLRIIFNQAGHAVQCQRPLEEEAHPAPANGGGDGLGEALGALV